MSKSDSSPSPNDIFESVSTLEFVPKISESDQKALEKFEAVMNGFREKKLKFSPDAYRHKYNFNLDGTAHREITLPSVISLFTTRYEDFISDMKSKIDTARQCRKYLNDAEFQQLIVNSDFANERQRAIKLESDLRLLQLEHSELQEKYSDSDSKRIEAEAKYFELKENFEAITTTCPKCNFHWHQEDQEGEIGSVQGEHKK